MQKTVEIQFPPPMDIKRRKNAVKSLRLFIDTYFSENFNEWTAQRKKIVETLQYSIVTGGYYNLLLPRGIGKTSLARIGVLWSILAGIKKNVVICCATKQQAAAFIEILFDLVEGTPAHPNPIIAADYPELIAVLREWKTQARKRTMMFCGDLVGFEYGKDRVVFPNFPSDYAGSMLTSLGNGGKIRGLNKIIGGKVRRADLILIDDLQTDTQAAKYEKSKKNYSYVSQTLLPLMFGEKYGTAINLATVIENRDFPSQLAENPMWQTIQTSVMEKFPQNIDLWRDAYDVFVSTPKNFFLFCKSNVKELERGAVYEPVEFNDKLFPGALAALMMEYFSNPEAFVRERQNNPSAYITGPRSDYLLQAEDLKNAVVDSFVPKMMTTGIDVHEDVMYFVNIGFDEQNRGCLLRCGVFPEQKILAKSEMTGFSSVPKYWSVTDPLRSAIEDSVAFANSENLKDLFGLSPSACFIDRGYRSDVVNAAIRATAGAFASKGHVPSVNQPPLCEKQAKNIVNRGEFFLCRTPASGGKLFYDIDVGIVKCDIAASIRDKRFLILKSALNSQLFAHFLAEKPVVKEGNYKRVYWINEANQDNHFFDAAVYAVAAAGAEKRVFLRSEPVKPRSKLTVKI